MRIFISYQTLDDAVAKSVSDGIKAQRPNAESFFAPETLPAGAYWLPRLAQEIRDSHAVVLLIGKRIGKWQELEYLEAVRLARDTANRSSFRLSWAIVRLAFLFLINITVCFFASRRAKQL